MSSSQLDFASMDSISTDLCDNEPEVLGKKLLTETLTTSLCQGSVIS